MKTVIKPSTPEVVQYVCDVTGTPLPHGPIASLTIKCGYGSAYDGNTFVLDLSEAAADIVLPLLRALLLDGAPLEPHCTEALFGFGALDEKPITHRKRDALLGQIVKLCRHRMKTRDRRVQESTQ
jgi:hypothetical protein